jgi:pimeloyl-ACP methyl ester carboxylesterase
MEKKLEILGFRCRVIVNQAAGMPIAFLHGYSFTSQIWKQIGIPQLLRAEKIPFLAIDMPYGLKSVCNPKTRNPEVSVNVLKKAVHLLFKPTTPMLVGASLGGHIALRYAVDNPVQGMLLAAPVRSFDEDLVKSYQKLAVPIYLIYGTKDNIVSLDEMKHLTDQLPNATLLLYTDAKHPAYLDEADMFKTHILELYKRVSSRDSS